eukprot:UN08732
MRNFESKWADNFIDFRKLSLEMIHEPSRSYLQINTVSLRLRN